MRVIQKSPASASTKPTIRDRATALKHSLAAVFSGRHVSEVTDQPQRASLTEGSAADRRESAFPTSGAASNDADRGQPIDLGRADAARGRAPHREHDMGRHETFENATAIADQLLSGTSFSRRLLTVSHEPGSPEAIAAWHAACHEHSVRTASLQNCPDLMRTEQDVWSTKSLMRAMETGEITVAEYARLHPIASERELRFDEIAHELNIGSLFALAYANEYPVQASDGADPEVDEAHAAIAEHRAAYAAWKPLGDAANETTTDYAALAAAEAEPYRIQAEAFSELIDTRATTVGGLVALASYLPGAVFDANCVEVEEDARRALRSMCNGVLALFGEEADTALVALEAEFLVL